MPNDMHHKNKLSKRETFGAVRFRTIIYPVIMPTIQGPIRCHGLSYRMSNDSKGSATLWMYLKWIETNMAMTQEERSNRITLIADTLKNLQVNKKGEDTL